MMRPRTDHARRLPISSRVPGAQGSQTRQAATGHPPPVLRVPVSDIECVCSRGWQCPRRDAREPSASSRRPFRLRSTAPTGQHRVASLLLSAASSSPSISPSRHLPCASPRRPSHITAATIPPSPSVPFFPSSMETQNIQQQEIARKQCPSARRGLERASRQRERMQGEIYEEALASRS